MVKVIRKNAEAVLSVNIATDGLIRKTRGLLYIDRDETNNAICRDDTQQTANEYCYEEQPDTRFVGS